MASCEDCIHNDVCDYRGPERYATIQDMKNDCAHCIPAADVVPKSECMMCGEMTGKVIVQLQEQIAELNKRQFPSYCRACSEEEAINIGREYGKTEVAREIFADLETYVEELDGCSVNLSQGEFAELKKKYTGG